MEFTRRDGVMTVRIAQDDLDRATEVFSAVQNLIVNEKERRISLDLSEVEMLTSLMIGTLVSLHLLAYENVVVLTFDGLHEKMKALFKLVGIDKLMEAHYGAPSRRGSSADPSPPQDSPGAAG